MLLDDTIVAIATAEGQGGLAVVRLSGPAALSIARRIVAGNALAEPVSSHRARLAILHWPLDAASRESPIGGEFAGAVTPGQELDEALVLPLLSPQGYTGEDTVEFSCHGGWLPARLVAAACEAAGARAAGPGEFTRRAFLNGKLSLAEAEAVADLIQAEHAAGARAALAQLRGGLEREIATLGQPLRALLAALEGAMEFADEEDPGPPAAEIAAVVAAGLSCGDHLAALAGVGKRLREGVQVVLAGPPNAGKSSLFNALLGEDRALVDAQAGTTRDVVSARVVRGGLLYVLHDTAGLRDDGGRIEQLGMRRTEQAVAAADVVLFLTAADDDATVDVAAPAGSAVVTVVAKCDTRPGAPVLAGAVATSSVTRAGLDELWHRIEREAGAADLHGAAARGVLLNARHQARLRACRGHLADLAASLRAGPVTTDIVASSLRLAVLELDEISGRVFTEQLLADIFGRFCVGK
jgi:tRNA modification GTPase